MMTNTTTTAYSSNNK
jgi:hypothetical protein